MKLSRRFHLKYRHKIMIVILLFTFLPCAIFGLFYIRKTWRDKVEVLLSEQQNLLKERVESIANLFSTCVQKMIYINNNQIIGEIVRTPFTGDVGEAFTSYDRVKSIFDTLRVDNQTLGINVYSFDENVYNGEYIRRMEKFDDSLEASDKELKDLILNPESSNPVIWKYRMLNETLSGGRMEDYICLYERIMSLNNPLAITEIRIPYKQVTQQFQYEIPEGSFILYLIHNDEDFLTLNANNMQLERIKEIYAAYSTEKDHKSYEVIEMNIKLQNNGMFNGSVCMFIPKSYFAYQLRAFIYFTPVVFIILAMVILFIVELVSFFLTRKLSDLILKVNSDFEKMATSNNANIQNYDEFGQINSRFYEMVEKIKEYYLKMNVYESEKKTLELELMQARINPHFLYNTLSALRWKSTDNDLKEVIDSMVTYYRAVLNKGSNIVTIYEELEMIIVYLNLQRFAYGVDFKYMIEVNDEVLKYTIIRHLLQPVVENAVLHGINGKGTEGFIRICGRLSEECVILEVVDNGEGMEVEKVEQMMNGGYKSLYGGYGTRSVQKRIELYYGKEYGINIKSVKGHGTTVTIIIPANEENENNKGEMHSG